MNPKKGGWLETVLLAGKWPALKDLSTKRTELAGLSGGIFHGFSDLLTYSEARAESALTRRLVSQS